MSLDGEPTRNNRNLEFASNGNCHESANDQLACSANRLSCLRKGRPDVLTDEQQETVDAVLGFYGDKSPQWLSDLTHMELPWQLARRGIHVG